MALSGPILTVVKVKLVEDHNMLTMGRNATRLQIIFFSVLITGYVILQYSWVQSIQQNKWEQFKHHTATAMSAAAQQLRDLPLQEKTSDSIIKKTLQQSLFTEKLGIIPFEYQIVISNQQLTSRNFLQLQREPSTNLTFVHMLDEKEGLQPVADRLMITIPNARSIVLHDMKWIIAAAVTLTLLLITIFGFAWHWGHHKQQLFNARKSKAIEDMITQMRMPLHSIANATENMQHAMHTADPLTMKDQQSVIQKESNKINELLKRIFGRFD